MEMSTRPTSLAIVPPGQAYGQYGLSLLPEGVGTQPPPPGLYVTLGPDFLVGWALQILAQTIASPARPDSSPEANSTDSPYTQRVSGRIVWVDAANAFNAYIVSLSARRVYKDPAETLRSFLVARPFTAYQLETMISEKLLPAS